MKKLLLIIAAAALGGCAVAPPGPAYYGSRPVGQTDPNGWQVVSVTPVAPGTGARAAESGTAGTVTTSDVTYAPAPAYAAAPVYAPVYVPTPVYAPSPYLYDPYWYPPVSIGLGFSFGNSWGHRGGWGGHRGGFGGRGGFHRR
jgi:hypothetical protein